MKRILTVADEKGWAFERHCEELKRRITEYHIDIGYLQGTDVAGMAHDYDLVYVLDPMMMPYPPPEKTIIGLREDWPYFKNPEGPRGLYEKGFPGLYASIKDKCCMFHVVTRRQLRVFETIVTDKPLLLVQHGIDEGCFDRSRYKRIKNDILTIGTSGRADSRNNKGFEIVAETCRKLGVRHLTSRYKGQRLSKEQMPLFYNSIDVYVCMSETEGLCNTVMEAGAMGVPVISTRCGAVEEMIEDGISGFLIDRNINALVEALERMKDEKTRVEMGNRFYGEIMRNWTWNVKIADFRKMFELFFKERK